MRPETKTAAFYLSEVLGIRRYLRPPELSAVRIIRGPLPCRMLAVAAGGFSNPSSKSTDESRRNLLRKIMRAVGFEDFSVLELKRLEDLPAFLGRLKPGCPAEFVCVFGGRLPAGLAEGLKARPGFCFHTPFSLEDLDGGSSEAADRKRQLWASLQEWQNRNSRGRGSELGSGKNSGGGAGQKQRFSARGQGGGLAFKKTVDKSGLNP